MAEQQCSKTSKKIKYSERISYCPPLATNTNGEKPNDRPNVLWDILKKEGSILKDLPNNWHVVFPVGNYMPEDSNDTHVMISPNIIGEFSSINTLPEDNLTLVATMLLKFIKIAGPEGFAGYNIGIDHTRLSPQTWDNFHIHMIERGKLEYVDIGKGGILPKKLREPAMQQLSSVAMFVLKCYNGHGLGQLVDPQDGIFNGFPVSGAIAELQPNTTGKELIKIFKYLDSSYTTLHKQIFSSFVTNYKKAVGSYGVIPYKLRPQKEILDQLEIFAKKMNESGDLDCVINYLFKLAQTVGKYKSSHTLKDWNDYAKSKEKNGEVADTDNKIITPPSYSVSLAHRKGKNYLVFAPHLLRQAGSQDILGTLTPRIYRDGESFSQRKLRGHALAKKIVELFEV